MKVTIAWYDPPSVIGSITSLLIHDVDLVVRSPRGHLHWGNEAFVKLQKDGHGDVKNPNEQVSIHQPFCDEGFETCTYDVYIRAHSLFARKTQNVALVITSSGLVTDPVYSNEWFGSDFGELPTLKRPQNQTYSYFDTSIRATLAGGEFESSSFHIPTCGQLRVVQAKLRYNNLNNKVGQSMAGYIEITLQGPSGKAVSIGGSDSSVGKAKMTTEWPNSWNDGSSGDYYATIDVSDAKIFGCGTWTIYAMNSYSVAGPVSYDFSATLQFYGGSYDSCAPTSAPTTGGSKGPHFFPKEPLLSSYDMAYEIPFSRVSLGAREIPDTNIPPTSKKGVNLVQDRFVLAAFPFSSGVLQSVKITLEGLDASGHHTLGTDSWLMSVLITTPDGKMTAQVGGYKYLGRHNHFYYRHWPDPWNGKVSNGANWSSTRDVSAAKLSGYCPVEHHYGGYLKRSSANNNISPAQGLWIVELAMGCNYPRAVADFSGTLTLHFANTDCESNNCEQTVVRLDAFSSGMKSSIPPERQSSNAAFLSLVALACLLVVIAAVRMMIFSLKTRQAPQGQQLMHANSVVGDARRETYGSV